MTMECLNGSHAWTTHCRRYAWNDSFLAATSSAVAVCGARDALAPYVREMLLDSRTLSRPYIQRNVLESLVRRACQRRG